MIRLEYIFKQLFAFGQSLSTDNQHVAFATLFQLMDVCDRGDCRNWVLQEIEKQKQSLEAYRHFPEVNLKALDETTQRLDKVAKTLANASKLGSHIRENEWLLTLKNRFLTPGATSAMDFPAYAAWMSGHELERQHVLQELIQPFMPLYDAIHENLLVLREAAVPNMESSKPNGVFEKSIGGKVYQMARVWVPEGKRIYPEISGNKHVVMIRFFQINEHFRHHLVKEAVGFKMALCQL